MLVFHTVVVLSRRDLLILIVTFGLIAPPVGAQAPESNARAWDISVWAAGATGEESTNSFAESQILTTGIFAGKMLTGEIGSGWQRGRLELGVDFVPLFVQFTPQRIHGIAFDPIILRWNSSLRRGRVTPYLELGGGAVHTNANFPSDADTSDFNFIVRGGGGFLIKVQRAQAFEIGCRWWHISNANLATRNPEFNGIQLNVGWHWFK
jgi:lipid A 3-O-deacylase